MLSASLNKTFLSLSISGAHPRHVCAQSVCGLDEAAQRHHDPEAGARVPGPQDVQARPEGDHPAAESREEEEGQEAAEDLEGKAPRSGELKTV